MSHYYGHPIYIYIYKGGKTENFISAVKDFYGQWDPSTAMEEVCGQ